MYKTQQDYAKALEYYMKALHLFEQLDHKDGIGTNLGNIGVIYETMGDYKQSLEYSGKALKLYEQMGNKKSIAHNLGNIGLVHDQMGEYKTALNYIFKALAINEELGNKKPMANNYRSIGNVYYHMAVKAKENAVSRSAAADAIRYFSKGLAIAGEMGDLKNLQEIHDLLSRVHLLSGNYKVALESYQKYILFKDSVFSAKNAERITGLTKRELDIRDKEIEIRNKQIELDKLAVAKKRNERNFFIAGILVLVLIIVTIFKANRLLAKEKMQSENLLLNILPSEVANELKEKGITEARQFDEVTVLFTDFVDFTKAGEKLSPKELVTELHNCFIAFDDIISKYNIEKIKTIGDAYLAVSGLPNADPRHAEHTVNAALEIRHFMNIRKQALGDKTFDVRIGIHSGPVVAGIVGVKKFAYDIWGDTVNTAARMEQNSEPGRINISNSTYELVQQTFHCDYRGEIEAKNKGMLRMYFLEERKMTEELVLN